MSTTIQRDGLPAREMHEVHRIDHEGAVDADGHILEPPDLWDEYLESKYKDRALRIRSVSYTHLTLPTIYSV